MAKANRPRGAEYGERGPAITQVELDAIHIMLDRGYKVSDIARKLQRGRASIYRVISAGMADQKPLFVDDDL